MCGRLARAYSDDLLSDYGGHVQHAVSATLCAVVRCSAFETVHWSESGMRVLLPCSFLARGKHALQCDAVNQALCVPVLGHSLPMVRLSEFTRRLHHP